MPRFFPDLRPGTSLCHLHLIFVCRGLKYPQHSMRVEQVALCLRIILLVQHTYFSDMILRFVYCESHLYFTGFISPLRLRVRV